MIDGPAPEGVTAASARDDGFRRAAGHSVVIQAVASGASIGSGVLAARHFGSVGRTVYDLTHHAALVGPWLLTAGAGWGAVQLRRSAHCTAADARGILHASTLLAAAAAGVGAIIGWVVLGAPEVVLVMGGLPFLAYVEHSTALERVAGCHRWADWILVVRHLVLLVILGAIVALTSRNGGSVVAVGWLAACVLGALLVRVWRKPARGALRVASTRRDLWARVRAASRAGFLYPVPQVFVPALHLLAVASVAAINGPAAAAPLGVALGVAGLVLHVARSVRLVHFTWNAPSSANTLGAVDRPVTALTTLLGVLAVPATAVLAPILYGPGYGNAAALVILLVPGAVAGSAALTRATFVQRSRPSTPAPAFLCVLLAGLLILPMAALAGTWVTAIAVSAGHLVTFVASQGWSTAGRCSSPA